MTHLAVSPLEAALPGAEFTEPLEFDERSQR